MSGFVDPTFVIDPTQANAGAFGVQYSSAIVVTPMPEPAGLLVFTPALARLWRVRRSG